MVPCVMQNPPPLSANNRDIDPAVNLQQLLGMLVIFASGCTGRLVTGGGAVQ